MKVNGKGMIQDQNSNLIHILILSLSPVKAMIIVDIIMLVK